MLCLKRVQRALPLAWLLVGCNAILGIEERDLVVGVGGGAAGTVAQSGSSGVAGSGSDGGEPGSSGDGAGAGGSSSAGTAGSGFGGTPAQADGGAGGDETGGASPFGGSGGAGSGGKGGNGGNGGTFSTGGGGGTSPAVDCSPGITTTSSGMHTHTLTVTGADIAAGVNKTYATSVTSGHNHWVQLTAADFSTLNGGTQVKKKSCAGGDHEFVLKCGGGASAPGTPTCSDECGGTDLTTCP